MGPHHDIARRADQECPRVNRGLGRLGPWPPALSSGPAVDDLPYHPSLMQVGQRTVEISSQG